MTVRMPTTSFFTSLKIPDMGVFKLDPPFFPSFSNGLERTPRDLEEGKTIK
jgi:hypothetical protein